MDMRLLMIMIIFNLNYLLIFIIIVNFFIYLFFIYFFIFYFLFFYFFIFFYFFFGENTGLVMPANTPYSKMAQ